MTWMNRIHCGDCIEVLQEFPEGCIDLVVTSPPYNVNLGANKYNRKPYDLYQDNLEHKDYLSWMSRVVSELDRVLVTGGRVALNIGDGKNGAVPTHSDLIQLLSAKWLPMGCIIWDKHHRSNTCAWGTFCSPRRPSFPMGHEYILLFAKGQRSLFEQGVTDLTKEEFVAYARGIWTIAPERNAKKIGHPAPFPEEIPHRLIKMLSWVGATVLDPFCGSGTTCMVARRLQRQYVGIDISETYAKIAEERTKT